MAPERLRAQPYGRSSDVWSAGLVILECLTGECPWKDSDSIVSLLVTVEETTTKDIIPDSASSVLQEFLMGCLNQLPGKGYDVLGCCFNYRPFTLMSIHCHPM